MIGIGYPTPLTAYHTGGRNPTYVPDILTTDNSDEPFLVWAQYMAGLPDDEVPQVISTSYGDDEQTVSRAYAQAVCNQFAQLGARGVSLFFSSGDFGVGTDETCISNIDNTTAMFMPSFPTDCPCKSCVPKDLHRGPVAVNDCALRHCQAHYLLSRHHPPIHDPEYQH